MSFKILQNIGGNSFCAFGDMRGVSLKTLMISIHSIPLIKDFLLNLFIFLFESQLQLQFDN